MLNADRPGIRDYLSVLSRRKWVVALTLVIVATVALTYSLLRTPVYEAHARVLISPSQSAFQTNYGNYIDPNSIQTEIEVLQAAPVRQAVLKRLGRVPAATAAIVGTTAVIDITARSSRAPEAAVVATAYAEEYINLRRRQSLDGLLGLSTTLQKKIDDIQKQLDDANRRATAAAGAAPQTSPTRTPEQERLESQKAAYKDKLDQLSIESSLQNGGPQLVSPAAVPAAPILPTPRRNLAIGLLLGLILGVGLAFLADQLDESIKDRDDLERFLGDLPVLGVIPRVVGWRNRGEARLVSSVEPNSSAAEAYRTLRTSIRFIGVSRAMGTIQITSPSAGEGKTTTTANLAVALARAGQKVTVVSCDLRRPRIQAFFGMSESIGFSSVLLGSTPLLAAVIQVPGIEGLSLLASGPLPPNPSELLTSSRAAEVIEAVKDLSDTVLIDCPPVLPVTDAAAFSARVDGTILVASAGMTTRKQLRRSLTILHQVGAPVVGVVLNCAAPEGAYGYEYDVYGEVADMATVASPGTSTASGPPPPRGTLSGESPPPSQNGTRSTRRGRLKAKAGTRTRSGKAAQQRGDGAN